ncbi:MAG: hypothetical protein WAO19_06160 [Candidatus Kryptoniota bacterium]
MKPEEFSEQYADTIKQFKIDIDGLMNDFKEAQKNSDQKKIGEIENAIKAIFDSIDSLSKEKEKAEKDYLKQLKEGNK